MTELTKIGRLALRVEGDNWCAYYAMPDSMADAVPLASIRMKLVANEDRKKAFMTLMRAVVGDLIEESMGKRPSWKHPRGAPEHERGGNA
jgi:hypothetical protein